MEKHEELYQRYLNVLENQSKQWEEIATKANDFGDKDEYIKLQIKSGIAMMCKALFIKTYREVYGK